jgi:RNA recognition motif-containing protein
MSLLPFSSNTSYVISPGLSIPGKEVLRRKPPGMESSSNESDTSLDERKNISRRLQILDSSGDETDDAYVKAEKGKGTTEIDDTLSEAPSEASSNSSQKRKGSPKRGNRRQKSKARGATSPATPSIPGNRLYVGDIPLNSTEKETVTFFSKIGEVKEGRMMKKNNGTFKVRQNMNTIPVSYHILKH